MPNRTRQDPVEEDREEEEKYGNRSDDLEVKTGFGTVRAGGRQVSLIVVIVLCCGFLAYQQWQHEQNGVRRTDEFIRQMISLESSIREMTYVVSLSPEKQAELNLMMPETLKWRLLGQPVSPITSRPR